MSLDRKLTSCSAIVDASLCFDTTVTELLISWMFVTGLLGKGV